MTRRAVMVAIGAVLLTPALSDAHLMPEGQGSSKVVGNRAYSLISVPVAVLSGFDDDGNGAISDPEARTHFKEIQAQIDRRVQLFDGRNVPGVTVYQDLQVPHVDSSSAVQSNSVIQIRVSQWDVAPTALRVRADIFTRQQPELLFRAIIGDSTETATLTARRPQYAFFMGPGANAEGPSAGRLGVAVAVSVVLLAAVGGGLRRRRRQLASV